MNSEKQNSEKTTSNDNSRTLLISCWNSKSERLFSHMNESLYERIIICSDDASIAEIAKRFNKFSVTSTEAPLYIQGSKNISQQINRLEGFCSNDLDYFNKDTLGLMQCGRLNLKNETLDAIYIKLLNTYMYWVSYLKEYGVTDVIFPICPHTGSDYMLYRAAVYLNITVVKYKHSRDNTFLSRRYKVKRQNEKSIEEPIYNEKPNTKGSIAMISETLKPYIGEHEELGVDVEDYKNTVINKIDKWHKGGSRTGQYIKQKKVVCYFMHIDPEMTINPEGTPYISQYSAICSLLINYKGVEEMHIRDHPHLRRYFEGEFGQEYIQRRRRLISALKNTHENKYVYVGNQKSASESLKSGIVPATITGDIAIEASILGLNSITLGKWWDSQNSRKFGFLSEQDFKNELVQADKTVLSERFDNILEYFEKNICTQVMYVTEATRKKLGKILYDKEEELAIDMRKLVEHQHEEGAIMEKN